MTNSTASAVQVLSSSAARGQLLVVGQVNLNELPREGIQHEHLRCAMSTPHVATENVINTKENVGGACGHLSRKSERRGILRFTLSLVQSIAQKLDLAAVSFGAKP